MQGQHGIDALLRHFYNRNPFPNDLQPLDDEQERRHLEIYRLFLQSLNLSLERVTNGLILDAGCGAGDTAIRRFARWGARTICVDIATEPLRLASAKVEKLAFSKIWLVNGSVLQLPFADEQFDVVHSCGVLHHTGNVYAGFRELVRVCKKGGIIILGLYNKYGGFSRTVRRIFLRIAAGSSLEKQMSLAAKIFPPPKDKKMSVDVYLSDHYGHPVESKHSYGEVLSWFEKQNIQYTGSAPSLCLRMFWNVTLQQLMTSRNPRIQRICRALPKIIFKEEVEGKPHLHMRAIIQILMLIAGHEMFNVVGTRR